jgi:hypothetical protein
MPSTGTLNVTVFDAGRNIWQGPPVRLTLTDPFTNSSHMTIVGTNVAQGISNIRITDVPTDAGQLYILFVDADEHRSHGVFPVKPRPNTEVLLKIMLIPNNPVPNFSDFTYEKLRAASPVFHDALKANITESDFLGLANGDPDFGAARMAACLNIEAKLRATALKEEIPAVESVRLFPDLSACEPDRIKIRVDENMPDNVRGLNTFTELPAELNELNHKGFPISFKQKIFFASLQLSFARNAVDGVLAADIDIDLLTDIGHFGEVIRNKITKMKTDPYTVYNSLFDQGIEPLYTLET